jgi:hypothetical protein
MFLLELYLGDPKIWDFMLTFTIDKGGYSSKG